MSSLRNFTVTSGTTKEQSLRVDLKMRKITVRINVFRFIHKDTKQVVIYIPSLDITGYGENFEKANEMVKFSVKDFFDVLINLPQEKIQTELTNLGWRKGIFNKQYSRDYVDINGNLKGLNAEHDKVEGLTLTAA